MTTPINDNFSDRLYVGGFSSSLSSDQIKNLISQASAPFDVSIEIVENGSRKHRGFAFVQCGTPTEAAALLNKYSGVFTKVNFAKREPKPAENVMSNISNIFVRGVSREMTDTEFYQAFGGVLHGVVQCHVADGYGFVLFDTRQNAQKKIIEMDGAVLKGQQISVTWARPDVLGGRKRKRAEENQLAFSNDLSSLLKRPVQPLNIPLATHQLFQFQPHQNLFLTHPHLLNPLLPHLFAQPQPDLSAYLNFLI